MGHHSELDGLFTAEDYAERDRFLAERDRLTCLPVYVDQWLPLPPCAECGRRSFLAIRLDRHWSVFNLHGDGCAS